MPFAVPCTGGDAPAGYTLPPLDCGTREYAVTMALIPAAPSRVLAWAGEVDPASEDLYTNCPVGVDMAPGQFMAADDGITELTRTDADLPVDQLLDPGVPRIELTGQAEGHRRDAGSLDDTEYTWTLTLCRIVAGAPAC